MTHSSIIPTFRYRNAAAAIDFLKTAFGFEEVTVNLGEDGSVSHAELRFGGGMVMVGSQAEDWMRTVVPREVGGVTCSAYLVVTDPDAHARRAEEAGAEIVRPLEETFYGSREYSARDPEGHLWHFGTYDPFSTEG
jgi:uncharacterized glyoxalase superfamily protein PhnB